MPPTERVPLREDPVQLYFNAMQKIVTLKKKIDAQRAEIKLNVEQIEALENKIDSLNDEHRRELLQERRWRKAALEKTPLCDLFEDSGGSQILDFDNKWHNSTCYKCNFLAYHIPTRTCLYYCDSSKGLVCKDQSGSILEHSLDLTPLPFKHELLMLAAYLAKTKGLI